MLDFIKCLWHTKILSFCAYNIFSRNIRIVDDGTKSMDLNYFLSPAHHVVWKTKLCWILYSFPFFWDETSLSVPCWLPMLLFPLPPTYWTRIKESSSLPCSALFVWFLILKATVTDLPLCIAERTDASNSGTAEEIWLT